MKSIVNLAVRPQFKIMASKIKPTSTMAMLINGINHHQHRYYHQREKPKIPKHQRSYEIVKFDEQIKNAIKLNVSAKVPTIEKHNELLVKVLASSINPIDIEMAKGFAESILQLHDYVAYCGTQSQLGINRLPLKPGRDFVGEVIDRGTNCNRQSIGDWVWGAVPPHENGSHADYVVVKESQVCDKPLNLTSIDAAAIPYVALTAWSALTFFGGLTPLNCYKKNILVLGGSGGVGCFAIQLLKYWKANVYTTCSPKLIQPLIELTDVKECVDYNNTEEFLNNLDVKMDFVLDASSSKAARKNFEMIAALIQKGRRVWDPNSTKYVTLTNPMTNQFGWQPFYNEMRTLYSVLEDSLRGFKDGIDFRYAFYLSDRIGLIYIKHLIENGVIKPFTSLVYNFEDILDAYEAADKRELPLLGKIVIDHQNQ